MRVQFVETMRGELTDPRGTYPAEFTVKARAARLRDLLRTGIADLTGVVRAPPFVVEAPAHGTLRFDLARGQLAYALAFDGLRLVGHKQVSLLHLLRSMTQLPIELRDCQDNLLARGTFAFALRDAPAFLATWLPGAERSARALDVVRRSLERARLDIGRPT